MEVLTMTTSQPIINIVTDWLTSKEANAKTGYSVQYIQRLARQGKIESVVKGGTLLVNPKSLEAYCEKMRLLGEQKHNWRRLED